LERVARRFAFAPQRLTRARPEVHFARFARAAKRFLVHPREHQQRAGLCVLHDARHEPTLVVRRNEHVATFASGDRGVKIVLPRRYDGPVVIASGAWKAQPWKNGRGTTWGVLRIPDAAEYDLRISVA